MPHRLLIGLCLLGSACTRVETEAPELTVSNVTIGLMRERADGVWYVYSRGDRFPLVPNGSCVVAGKARACMWYGVEFDFKSTSGGATLACRAKLNKPTDLVSAESVEAVSARGTTFEIVVEGEEGHMAVPASVFRQPEDSPDPWTVEIGCSHRDREVLRYKFTALYEG